MKKACIAGLACLLIVGTSVNAQQQDTTTGEKIKIGAKKTGKAIEKGAKKAGNKTAELASKGSSAVVDKVYDGKVGPAGQTIYINDKSQYYWVDKKGKRHYVPAAELRNKKD